MVLPQAIWFCREQFDFAVSLFAFAVSNFVLPWAILFLPRVILCCRDSCGPPYESLGYHNNGDIFTYAKIYILLDVLLCSIAEYFQELCRILTSP